MFVMTGFAMALLTNVDLSWIDSYKHISMKFWSKSKDCKTVSICWDLILLKGYKEYGHWRWTSESRASVGSALTILTTEEQYVNSEKKTNLNNVDELSHDILQWQHFNSRSSRNEISWSNDKTIDTRSVVGSICYPLLIVWNCH